MRTLYVGLTSFFFLTTAGICPGARRSQSSGFGSISQLLQAGTVEADVMQMSAPPPYAELSARFTEALRRDPAWATAYLRAAPEGQPLPYHPRLGLDEAEYRTMLALTDSMRIRSIGSVPLILRSTAAGWRFDGGSTLPDLTGIEIDTAAGVVRTAFGEAPGPTVEPATPEQKVTGPVDRLAWRREALSSDLREGVSINFSLGRLRESGRTLLYYDAKRITSGALTARVSRILMIDAPPDRPTDVGRRAAVDGRLLTPSVDTMYSIVLRAAGADTTGVGIQTLARSRGSAGDEWLQVYQWKGTDGASAIDSLVMDYRTLLPLRQVRNTTGGNARLTYTGARVRARIEPTAGAVRQLDTTFEHSVFASGAFDLLARALPLPASYATEAYLYYPYPSPDGVRRARMWVERSDVIRGRDGSRRECWVVVGALPGSDTRIWVDKGSRQIVQILAEEGGNRILQRR